MSIQPDDMTTGRSSVRRSTTTRVPVTAQGPAPELEGLELAKAYVAQGGDIQGYAGGLARDPLTAAIADNTPEDDTALGTALDIATLPVRLPVQALQYGVRTLAFADEYLLSRPASTLMQATGGVSPNALNNPLYSDGIQWSDFVTMWNATEDITYGDAADRGILDMSDPENQKIVAQDPGRIYQPGISPGAAAAINLGRAATSIGLEDPDRPWVQQGFNPYDVDAMRALKDNTLWNIGTGGLDTIFQLAAGAKGGGALSNAVKRGANIATGIKSEKNLLRMDALASAHKAWRAQQSLPEGAVADMAGPAKKNVYGEHLESIAASRDVWDIMNNPLLHRVWGRENADIARLADILSKTSDYDTVNRLILSHYGHRKSIADLLKSDPDLAYTLSNMDAKLATELFGQGFKATDQAEANAFKAVFDKAVDRTDAFRQIREQFLSTGSFNKPVSKYGPEQVAAQVEKLAGRGITREADEVFNPVVGAEKATGYVATKVGSRRTAMGVLGVDSPIGRAAAAIQTDMARTKAAVAVGAHDGTLMRIAEKIDSAYGGVAKILRAPYEGGPATVLLQWGLGKKPLGVVSFSRMRPLDTIDEVLAYSATIGHTRGNKTFAVTKFTEDGIPLRVTTTGQEWRRDAVARITAASSRGEADVLTAVRELEAELISSVYWKHSYRGVTDEVINAQIKAINDLRDVSQQELRRDGFWKDEAGNMVRMSPQFRAQLADNIMLVPLGEVDRALYAGTLHGKALAGKAAVDSAYEFVQKWWRTSVLFKPGYTLKNSIAEPWIGSLLSHGSILSADGWKTVGKHYLENWWRRAHSIAYTIGDRAGWSGYARTSRELEILRSNRQALQHALATTRHELAADELMLTMPATRVRNLRIIQAEAAELKRQLDEIDALIGDGARDLPRRTSKWGPDDPTNIEELALSVRELERQARALRADANYLYDEPRILYSLAEHPNDAQIIEELNRAIDNIMRDATGRTGVRRGPWRDGDPVDPAVAYEDQDILDRFASDPEYMRGVPRTPIGVNVEVRKRRLALAPDGTDTPELRDFDARWLGPATNGARVRTMPIEVNGKPVNAVVSYYDTVDGQWKYMYEEFPGGFYGRPEDFPDADILQFEGTYQGAEAATGTFETIWGRHGIMIYDDGTFAISLEPGVLLHYERNGTPKALGISPPGGGRVRVVPLRNSNGDMIDHIDGYDVDPLVYKNFDEWIPYADDLDTMYVSHRGEVQARWKRGSGRGWIVGGDNPKIRPMEPAPNVGGATAWGTPVRTGVEGPDGGTYRAARYSGRDYLWDADGEPRFRYNRDNGKWEPFQAQEYREWYPEENVWMPTGERDVPVLEMHQFGDRELTRSYDPDGSPASVYNPEEGIGSAELSPAVQARGGERVFPPPTGPRYEFKSEMHIPEPGAPKPNLTKEQLAEYQRVEAIHEKLAASRKAISKYIDEVQNGATQASARKVESLSRAIADLDEEIAGKLGRQTSLLKKREWARSRVLTGETDVFVINVDGKTLTTPGMFSGPAGAGIRQEFSAGHTTELTMDPTAMMRAQRNMLNRSGNGTLISPDEPDYIENLVYVINRHVRTDPVAQRILRGESDQDIIKWLRTPEGEAYRREMGWDGGFADGPHGPLRRVQRKNVGDTEAGVRTGRAKGPDPREPEPLDLMVPIVADARQALRSYIPPESGLWLKASRQELQQADILEAMRRFDFEPIHGNEFRSIVDQRWRKAVNDTLNKTWRLIATLPEDRLARMPWAQVEFKREMQATAELLRSQGVKLTAKDINAIRYDVIRRVLAEAEQTFYTIRRYNNAVYAMRYLMGFPGAFFNSLYRTAKLSYQNPSRAMVGASAVYGAYMSMGVDSDGKAVQDWRNADHLVINLPKPIADRLGRDQEIGISLKSWEFALQDPNVGWTVTIPMNTFLSHYPKPEKALRAVLGKETFDMVFPFGMPTNANDFSILGVSTGTLIPGWAKDMYRMVRPDDGPFKQVAAQSYQYLLAEWEKNPEVEEWLDTPVDKRSEMPPVPAPTPEDASRMAADYFKFSAFSKFFMTGGFTSSPVGQYMRDAWRETVNQYGGNPQAAYPEFLKQHGDWARWYSYSTSATRASVPSTDEAIVRWTESEDLIRSLVEINPDEPGLATLMFADTYDGPFNPLVYDYLAEETLPGDPSGAPLRTKLGPEDWLSYANTGEAWKVYVAKKAERDALMLKYGYKALRSTGESAWLYQQWHGWLDSFAAQPENEQFAAELSNANFQRTQQYVTGLQKITANRDFMSKYGANPMWEATQEYLDNLARAREAYAQAEGNTEARDAISESWRSWVTTNILPQSHEFATVYDRYLDERDLVGG